MDLPSGITQLKDGRYSVRPWDPVKRRRGETRKFKTLEEAIAYKQQVAAGSVKASARRWKVEEWVEEWSTNPHYERVRESTNIHNRERVSKLAVDFKGRWLDEIERSEARVWAMENKGRYGAVRAMFNDAKLEGVLAVNPFSELRVKRTQGRKNIEPMTEREVKLLAQIGFEKWEDWPVFGAMVLTAGYTGLRLGELLALRWSDLDWKQGVIKVSRQWSQKQKTYEKPKNNDERLVALAPVVVEALRKLDPHESPDGELVWYSPRGKTISPSLHDYYWRQVRERFLGKISEERATAIDLEWHVLRHFTASWLVDKGVPARDVAYQLGHTDGGRLVQELYGHRYPDSSLRRIQEAMVA